MQKNMARPKKYSPAGLGKAVELYFNSISREVPATERVDSGKRDAKGHIIWESKPIINKLGEQMTLTEYIVPPTVGGLCAFLGIHRSTWTEWCDSKLHPEFSDTTTYARGRMRAWREEQLLIRKDVKGIIFDLQNNYGYSEKREIELGKGAQMAAEAAGLSMSERKTLLEEIAREFGSHAEGEDPEA